MARDHARVKLSIWDDDDFRALSPAAQHLYFVLMTAPEMTYAGVADWRPNRVAKKAGAWTSRAVEIAAQELSERLYILIDTDTEEVLLRSLIRHDGLLEQPNLAVAVKKAWAAVASPELRGVIVHELLRLHKDKPELKGWDKVSELLDKPSIDPSNHPSFHPSDDPSGKGPGGGSVEGDSNPSDDPSPIPLPSSLLPTPAPSSNRTKDQDLGEQRRETLQAVPATKPIDDETCTRHPNGNPTNEACRGCQRVEERRTRRVEREAEVARLAAEDLARNCLDCEGTHKVLDPASKLPSSTKPCEHRNARRAAS